MIGRHRPGQALIILADGKHFTIWQKNSMRAGLTSLEIKDRKIRLWAENETADRLNYCMQIFLKTMDFTIISQITASGSVNAFESVCERNLILIDCYAYQELKLDSQSDKDPDETLFIEGVVIYEDGTMRRAVDTLLPYKYLQLPKPDFNIEIIRRGTEYEIDLTTKTFAAFVETCIFTMLNVCIQ